jgi:hypothetical protein
MQNTAIAQTVHMQNTDELDISSTEPSIERTSQNSYGENEQHVPDTDSSIIQTELKRPRQQTVSESSTWLIRHQKEPK